MSLSDPDVTQPNFALPRCSVPGCTVTEPGIGVETCVIWGNRRLCYAAHFPAFYEHPLSETCNFRGSGPTDAEWKAFLTFVASERTAA